MAIQNRRGQAVDFVPSKMLPGEFAVSLDNRKLYMCFASGTVKEVALTDDVTQAISTASTSLGGRIAVLESASTEQGATLLALVTRMGTAEAAIRSHDGRLVVLENDGTNIKARLSDVESETATLDELLTDLNLNMITISNDVEGLKSNAVRFDTVQNKSAAQKLQARENTDSAGIASLATAYSPSARYAVGDMVTYDGKLYTCKTAITTAEAWNAAHWTEVTVGDQLSDLKDDFIEWYGEEVPIQMSADAQFINLSGETADINNPSASGTGFHYGVVACEEGNMFFLNVEGGSSARAWGFINSQSQIIEVAPEGTIINGVITAPTNAEYLIINDRSGQTSYAILGKTIPERVSELETDVSDLREDVDSFEGLSTEAKEALLACFRHVAFLDDNDDYYGALYNALNGTPRLPDAYQEVTFIEGTGTQYITTNIQSAVPFKCKVKMQFKESTGGCIGTVNASDMNNTRFYLIGTAVVNDTDHIACRFGNGRPNSTAVWLYDDEILSLNEDYEISTEINENGNSTIYKSETKVAEGTFAIVPTGGYPISIMKNMTAESGKKIRIYSISFYNGNTKVFDGIPCYRKSDSAGGLYDIVNEIFYPNTGTGSFVLGDNV